jgi:hypothetical protein
MPVGLHTGYDSQVLAHEQDEAAANAETALLGEIGVCSLSIAPPQLSINPAREGQDDEV